MKTKVTAYILIPILAAFIFGIVGAYFGADYGANAGGNEGGRVVCETIDGVQYCAQENAYSYMGRPGYEGGALLGQHIGWAIGLLSGLLFWGKYTKKQ